MGFGGSQGVIGTTLYSRTNNVSFVVGAIGRSTNNTVQITTSLLLEGHIQFIGYYNSNVKKIVGSYSTMSGRELVDTTNLFFWKRSDAGSNNSEVPD